MNEKTEMITTKTSSCHFYESQAILINKETSMYDFNFNGKIISIPLHKIRLLLNTRIKTCKYKDLAEISILNRFDDKYLNDIIYKDLYDNHEYYISLTKFKDIDLYSSSNLYSNCDMGLTEENMLEISFCNMPPRSIIIEDLKDAFDLFMCIKIKIKGTLKVLENELNGYITYNRFNNTLHMECFMGEIKDIIVIKIAPPENLYEKFKLRIVGSLNILRGLV